MTKVKCRFCENESTHLCDLILGWKADRMMHTCDAPLCDSCRTQIGNISGVHSIDRCPVHIEAKDSFPTVILTDSEAEAIRRRAQFKIVTV